MSTLEHDCQMAQRIAEAVAALGGRTYFVGGQVRDRLMGRESRDVDIEVHGVTPQQLCAVLDGLGSRIVMGASFGVYALKGCSLDIAMPRAEGDPRRGKDALEESVDPFLGPQKAAERRDFTVNAMMEDVLTGEILDFFGGREDLQAGVIRHVSDRTFGEDPLRVLRAASFSARFGFSIAPETRAACAGLDLRDLPRERVTEETKKALLDSPRPSVFWEELRAMGQTDVWFAELLSVWQETMALLDGCAALRERAQSPVLFLMAALTAFLPARAAARFLKRLTDEAALLKYAANLVPLLAELQKLEDDRADRASFALLFDRALCPDDLLLLRRALRGTDGEEEEFLRTRLSEYRALAALPAVTGADLLAAGVPEGKALGEALRYAHRLHLSGVPKEEALPRAVERAGQ